MPDIKQIHDEQDLPEIDAVDRHILAIVAEDADLSSAELGKRIGLSSTAANDRLRRLRAEGYITAIVAVLNPKHLSKDLLAFVKLKAAADYNKKEIITQLAKIKEIEEIHSISGHFCFLLKVRTQNTDAMEKLFEKIYAIPHIQTSETDIAFRTYLDRPLQI